MKQVLLSGVLRHMLKHLSKISLITLLLFTPNPLFAPPDPNHFASTYNAWVLLHSQVTPGTVDARDLKAWKAVKDAWPEFHRMIDAEY